MVILVASQALSQLVLLFAALLQVTMRNCTVAGHQAGNAACLSAHGFSRLSIRYIIKWGSPAANLLQMYPLPFSVIVCLSTLLAMQAQWLRWMHFCLKGLPCRQSNDFAALYTTSFRAIMACVLPQQLLLRWQQC
jgi:hypothetical protein